MRRLVALILVAAVACALLPMAADGRKQPRRAAAGKAVKVAKTKRGRARMPARWGFARKRRPRRPAFKPTPPAIVPTKPGGSPSPVATVTPTATPPTVPTPNPRSVSVRSTEWALTLSQTTVSAGDVRVQFDNSRAEDPHELTLIGLETGDFWTTGEEEPGSVTSATYAMRPGVYRLFCPLPEHEERGMRARLTVRGP